jgi:hypothetical protein
MIRALICLALCAVVLAQPSCTGVKASDGTGYDLTAFANTIFQDIYNANGQQYTLNISICGANPAPCGACGANTAGVCQIWGPTSQSTKCFGTWSSAEVIGLAGGKGVQLKYHGGEPCGTCVPSGPRSAVITIACNPSATAVTWNTPYGAEPGLTPNFYINGTSAHACPGGGASGMGGWIFIIIVVCLLFVYFVGGIIFNAAVKKQRGKEMVPNSEFWCDLPALIGDGFKFLIGKCTGKGSGYTPVSA